MFTKPQKGKALDHNREKAWDHPSKDRALIQIIGNIEDPRKHSCNVHHSLMSMA
ncbi:MAG: hypothetical protein AAGF04_00925 [Chlamydiota bacterium]